MVGIGWPGWCVVHHFVTPLLPVGSLTTGEEFQKGAWTTGFNNSIQLIRFARMFTLLGFDNVHLGAPRRQGPKLSADAEEDHLCGIAKVKPDSTPVRTTILPNFMPDEVGLVLKSPCRHDLKPFAQQRIRYPEIEMAVHRRHGCHGDGFDGLERQGRITAETPMFGSHLAGPIAKLPGWISQNGTVGALVHLAQKGLSRG